MIAVLQDHLGVAATTVARWEARVASYRRLRARIRSQWSGAVRGCLGVLITPTAFVHGTGGFTYAGLYSSLTVTD